MSTWEKEQVCIPSEKEAILLHANLVRIYCSMSRDVRDLSLETKNWFRCDWSWPSTHPGHWAVAWSSMKWHITGQPRHFLTLVGRHKCVGTSMASTSGRLKLLSLERDRINEDGLVGVSSRHNELWIQTRGLTAASLGPNGRLDAKRQSMKTCKAAKWLLAHI